MSRAQGVFAVARNVFEHELLRDDKHPFSKVEAWLWLLANAAWKPHRRRVNNRTIELQRGQLAVSLRFLAKAWRWDEAKVRRLIARLKTDASGDAGSDAMIDASTDAGITVITIRNYNKYQRVSLPTDAASDTHIYNVSDGEPTQQRRSTRRKLEDKGNTGERQGEKKESSLRSQHAREGALLPLDGPSGSDPPDKPPISWPSNAFDLFWARFPHRVGKRAAIAAFARARARCAAEGVAFPTVMFALDRYVAEKPPDRAWCNPATWLNQDRWNDEPGDQHAKGNGHGGKRVSAGEAIIAGVAELGRELGFTDRGRGPDDVAAAGELPLDRRRDR